MKNQVTNEKIMEVLKGQDARFNGINGRFDKLDGMFKEIKESNNEILEAIGNYSEVVDDRFNIIDGRLTNIEATLNTQVIKKSHLDHKFKEYFGENVVAPAKALNYKTNKIATILEDKKIINSKEAESIRSMEIFPKPLSN